MLGLPAIYREHGRSYHADNCRPLVEAAQRKLVRFSALARGGYPGRRLAPSALPGVSSVGVWDAAGRQDWGLDWHRNEGIEFTFLEAGNLPFAVSDETYCLKPGDLTITRPWQPHRLGNPHLGSNRLHWLILDVGVRRPNQAWRWPPWSVLTKGDSRQLTLLLRHNEQAVWRATPEIRHCFLRISQAVENDTDGSNTSRLAAYLNELLVLVLDMLQHLDIELDASLSSTTRTVALFLEDLRSNVELLAQPWTNETMAAQCGLGVTRFGHYCRQLTNVTPREYLTDCRLDAAARLLKEQPGLTVTEVAFACGFSSSQYFATVFRRRYSVTPAASRKPS